MVENNNQGREARRYFIDCEKKAKAQIPQIDLMDPKQLRPLLNAYSEKVEAQQAELEETRPKAKALAFITRAENMFCITYAGKMLSVGRKEIHRWLHAHGYIYKRTGNTAWHAYQDKIKAGYLDTRAHTYQDSAGNPQITEQVMVTAKGLAHLAQKMNAILDEVG